MLIRFVLQRHMSITKKKRKGREQGTYPVENWVLRWLRAALITALQCIMGNGVLTVPVVKSDFDQKRLAFKEE